MQVLRFKVTKVSDLQDVFDNVDFAFKRMNERKNGFDDCRFLPSYNFVIRQSRHMPKLIIFKIN